MLRLVAQLVGTFDQRVWGSIPDHGLKIGRLWQSSEIDLHMCRCPPSSNGYLGRAGNLSMLCAGKSAALFSRKAIEK